MITVAAITGNLDYALRHTASGEQFHFEVARWYIQTNLAKHLHQLKAAVNAGAKIIVGPEYFTGSEMFTATFEQKRELVEPPDGPTAKMLCAFAAEHHVTIAAAYDMRHGNHIRQTGIIVTPQGNAHYHIKHNRGLPSELPETLELVDVPDAKVGILVCSDCQDPKNMLDMTDRGMNLLLLPGAGYYGESYREVNITRALDQRCPIIYSDDGRAMIVDHQGKVVAESCKRHDMIVARIEVPSRTISRDYWSYFNDGHDN